MQARRANRARTRSAGAGGLPPGALRVPVEAGYLRGLGTLARRVTIRPWRPRNPSLSKDVLPGAGRAHLFRDRERPSANATRGRRRRQGRRAGGVGSTRGTPKQAGAPPRAQPGRTRRSPAANPLPSPPQGPPDRRPADPLPGTQGSPAGSRPELHSGRARSSADPLPGSAPLPRSPPSAAPPPQPPNTSTARAAAQPPRSPARGPAPATAHVRAPLCAHAP